MSSFDKDTQLHTFDQLTPKIAAVVLSGPDSGQFNEDIGLNSKGVSIGGGMGSISDMVDASQLICEKGPNHVAVTACATGAHSIGDAIRMIQFGHADVMVAGGTESTIDAISIDGFCRNLSMQKNEERKYMQRRCISHYSATW